ncbi:MAG: NAD-dependent epimerase/dehydratase family protein [Bacteroidota bacterium]
MSKNTPVLVTGAGGFIGHHLVKFLKAKGYWVRGVDIKHPEFGASDADEFELLDLRRWANCLQAVRPALIDGERKPVEHVYALAADMGGMGFISKYHAEILHNNILINTHTMEAARDAGVKRYLYTSSACVYPEYLQTEAEVTPLKEEDAYPAQPQDAYGWEKLITEQLAFHYRKQYGMETRTVRFHNVYGELGTWEGGREKAPAAMMRKVAYAKLLGGREGQPGGAPQVEIWGDGEQTRSFMHVDDCVEGVYRLMMSDYPEPLNLGRDRMVTINKLADVAADSAGIAIEHVHIDGPQGVRGRNSDNDKLRQVLGWEPQIALEAGVARTYAWIEEQVREKLVREGVLPESAAGDGAQAEAALAS